MASHIDKLVAVYLKIRNAKQAAEKKHEEEMAKLDEQLKIITDGLLEHCKEAGIEGAKTAYGSFRKGIKSRYFSRDWEGLKKFVVEHNAPDLFESRLHQGNTATFIKENPDLQIPGLDVSSEYTITVTKPKAKVE
jgi:hypothetical protein